MAAAAEPAHLSVAVRAGMEQRKVKEMTRKRKMRKAGMWWQVLLHFPADASPSPSHDTLPPTQLQLENTWGTHVHTYTHTHIHTDTHIHTHIYTHIHTNGLFYWPSEDQHFT